MSSSLKPSLVSCLCARDLRDFVLGVNDDVTFGEVLNKFGIE